MSFPQCQYGGQTEQKNPARIVGKQGMKKRRVMASNTKELKNIKENYPEVWAWMEHKANWEKVIMDDVLNRHKKAIEDMKKVIDQDELNANNKLLRKALTKISEYWNGEPESATNAVLEMIAIAEETLEATDRMWK